MEGVQRMTTTELFPGARALPRLPHAPGAPVTEPGIYDMDPEQYHRDPVPGGSLSSSEARTILECPAKFNHARLEGVEEYKATFDMGSVAHKLVLGAGADIVVVDADDWRTKAAKEQQVMARIERKVPILRKYYVVAEQMAAAIREHPLAAKLLSPDYGTPEQAIFWDDHGVMRRALLDQCPHGPAASGRTIGVDYKTAEDASRGAFERAAASYRYHCQDAWYSDALAAAFDTHDVAFLFVVQEKSAPYLVNVIELDQEFRTIGAEQNVRALDIYRECKATGIWPGYGDEVQLATPPRWLAYQHEEDMNS
jgi:hypothetical protein